MPVPGGIGWKEHAGARGAWLTLRAIAPLNALGCECRLPPDEARRLLGALREARILFRAPEQSITVDLKGAPTLLSR